MNYPFLFPHLDAIGYTAGSAASTSPRHHRGRPGWIKNSRNNRAIDREIAMTKSGLKLGFIGLGIMGTPMVINLIKGGHSAVLSTTRSKVPQELVDARPATVCTTPAGVAERADIISPCADTPDVEKVLVRQNGIGPRPPRARRASRGGHELHRPIATRASPRRSTKLGGDYLDAPVSGGEVGAKAASLTIMVGGEPAVFEARQAAVRS